MAHKPTKSNYEEALEMVRIINNESEYDATNVLNVLISQHAEIERLNKKADYWYKRFSEVEGQGNEVAEDFIKEQP